MLSALSDNSPETTKQKKKKQNMVKNERNQKQCNRGILDSVFFSRSFFDFSQNRRVKLEMCERARVNSFLLVLIIYELCSRFLYKYK